MNLKEALVIALRSMRAAPLRTSLTTLGIVVGVVAVIVLVGLGVGMKSTYNAAFDELTDAITISEVTAEQPEGHASRPLTDNDVAALKKPGAAPDLGDVTPLVLGNVTLRYGDNTFEASVQGSDPGILDIRNRQIEAGTMFTQEQSDDAARLVVLSHDPVRYLFGGDDNAALGTTIQVANRTFKVIGVLAPAGDQDNVVMMPMTASRNFLFGKGAFGNQLSGIGVMAGSASQIPAAIAEIYAVLDKQHGITDPGLRDYSIDALENQLAQFNEILDFLTLFTTSIAGISLFVGALGVANIMLVTVTERTSEIGIRKAIGARRSSILKQFLIEATAISGAGGIAGVALGVAVTLIASRIVPRLAPGFGSPSISWIAVLLAFSISLVIGLLAGTYPAIRASRLHPIDALRY